MSKHSPVVSVKQQLLETGDYIDPGSTSTIPEFSSLLFFFIFLFFTIV